MKIHVRSGGVGQCDGMMWCRYHQTWNLLVGITVTAIRSEDLHREGVLFQMTHATDPDVVRLSLGSSGIPEAAEDNCADQHYSQFDAGEGVRLR